MTWTAAGASGTIKFREDTVKPIGGAGPAGGVKVNATSAFLAVSFGCSPGTVTGPDPGVITFDDPAVSFATTNIVCCQPGTDGGRRR